MQPFRPRQPGPVPPAGEGRRSRRRGPGGRRWRRPVAAGAAGVTLVAGAWLMTDTTASAGTGSPGVTAGGARRPVPGQHRHPHRSATGSTTTPATTAPTSTAPTSTAPTSDPAPAPTGAPAAWPGAGTTGVPAARRATLRPSGSVTVTTPGAVIEGLDVTGEVLVRAPGVVVRDCRITSDSLYAVQVLSGDVTVSDSELVGGSVAGIGFDHWSALRVDVHGSHGDGVKLGSHTLLQDSWVHDLVPDPGAHADGGQLQGGETDVTIRHDRIDVAGADTNAALFLAPDLGPDGAGPVTIEDNLFGGGNYTVFMVDGGNGTYHQRGYRVRGNRFLRTARYGPVRVNEPAASIDLWSGNVWDDTGAPVVP